MATHEHPVPPGSPQGARPEPADAVKPDNSDPATGETPPDDGVSIAEMNAAIARHGAHPGKYRAD